MVLVVSKTAAGLPVGMEITAPHNPDRRLLDIALTLAWRVWAFGVGVKVMALND